MAGRRIVIGSVAALVVAGLGIWQYAPRLGLTSGTEAPPATPPAGAADPAVGAGDEWPAINGDVAETGYSRLAELTPANVAGLGLAWSLALPGETTLEAAPLMIGGRLYFTGSGAKVYAVGAQTGWIAWTFDPKTWQHNPAKMRYGFAANRGVAYADGRIFSAAQDGRLYALDARTGARIWEVETTDPNNTMTVTGAPRLFDGKIVIGQGGADLGNRGYVAAYDQATGKRLWQFFVVPGTPAQNRGDSAMEAAARTWAPDSRKAAGGSGGGPWDSMTFDPELHRIYVGTANAFAHDSAARAPSGGDNLYTSSILALDADTGRYLWHYQLNPRDAWGFDATQQIMLATLTIAGKPRKVLMQAPKNGFFYTIDRETGKLISAGKIGKVTWADHIDLATGRPVEAPGIRQTGTDITIYPGTAGAHSWMRMAMSPRTGLVYVPIMQLGTRFRRATDLAAGADTGGLDTGGVNMAAATGQPGDRTGSLVAWDPVAQKAQWTVPIPTVWNGGALATAGDLVFQGAGDGTFSAYDAANGTRLWQRQLGMGVIAPPITWRLGGRQYVAVLAGYGGAAAIFSDVMDVGWKYSSPRRLFVFALDGAAAQPAAPPRSMIVAAQDNPAEVLDPARVAAGKPLYLVCANCHGAAAQGAGGPDLRESPIPLDVAAFRRLLGDGALLGKGMPRFDRLSDDQREAIRQYIRAQARAVTTGRM